MGEIITETPENLEELKHMISGSISFKDLLKKGKITFVKIDLSKIAETEEVFKDSILISTVNNNIDTLDKILVCFPIASVFDPLLKRLLNGEDVPLISPLSSLPDMILIWRKMNCVK